MKEPRPLTPTPTPQVHLPRSPLVRVIAQVRFPAILSIRNADKVAGFQDALRETYPNLREEVVHSIALNSEQNPDVRQGLIWRFSDREREAKWRVSLGVDFVALETSAYTSREDFLGRLGSVLTAVEQTFKPTTASRLGLRYIDRLTDEAIDHIGELIRPEALGILRPSEDAPAALGESVVHMLTEVQFVAQEGARVQGRWGQLPANATHDPSAVEPIASPTWILDLDMFTAESQSFASEELLATVTEFAECLYWLFRQVVKPGFLEFYGGKP